MTPVEIPLPPMRPVEWLAVIVDRQELGGAPAWTVTVNDGLARPWRSWFDRHPAALAFAAGQAERHGLPLFDLADPQ
jgi:hypothetical protein